jgi:hypothetical protein
VVNQPIRTERESGLNVAALVLGLVSMTIPFAGLVTAPLAIVLANVARGRGQGNALGTAGLVLGIIGSVLYGAFLALIFAPLGMVI